MQNPKHKENKSVNMVKKNIAIIAPLGISIPPKKQGGNEWMVFYIIEGLVKRGHKVLVFGPKTTKTSAKLVPIIEKPISAYKIPETAEGTRKLRLELTLLAKTKNELLKKKKEIGIVINFTVDGGIFAPLEKEMKVPVLHCLHLPLYEELAMLYKEFNSRLIALSSNEKKAFAHLNYVATIYNGIDFKRFPFQKKPKDYFLFSGKIRATKNPLAAIKAIKKTKQKLIIIGKINDKEYFDKKIKPALGKNIIYKGEVTFDEAIKLYSQAKALLFPIKWQEPFGLVMPESMACGTPVIAFNNGAASEVIKNGKTGFIVKNTGEMAKAIKKIDQIKREDCRKWVEKKFTKEKMVDEYEKILKKTLKKN